MKTTDQLTYENLLPDVVTIVEADQRERFKRAVEAIEATRVKKDTHFFFVRVNSRLERIDMGNVYLVEADDSHVYIHTREQKYFVRSTMVMMEEILSEDFMRVHKSFIVRLSSIQEIEKDTLTIENKIIPIGAAYRKQLSEKLVIAGV